MQATAELAPDEALARREEVLEICYWFRGEGFGDTFTATALKSFLPFAQIEIEQWLSTLERQGHLKAAEGAPGFAFTPTGLRLAARLFADGFTDFQQAGHGECVDNCCDDDDHSRCSHA